MVFVNKHLCLAAAVSLVVGFALCQRAEAGAMLNVQNYGAVGNGTTDDQAALETVFAIANRTPQSIILFPPGSYLHSGRLVVSGREVVVLGAQASLIGNNANAQALVVDNNKDYVEGLTFQGVPGGDPAIAATNVGELTINQNMFYGFTNCINISKSAGITFTNNNFYPGNNGTALNLQASSSITAQSNTFTGFEQPNLQTGIQLNGGTTFTIGPSNSFSYLNMGINVGLAKALRVTQNTFSNSAGSMNIQNGNTVEIDKNSLANTDRIGVTGSVDVAVHDNQLSNIQTQGVLSNQNTGTVRIGSNQLNNCGLSASTSPPAVIYASGGGQQSITNNNYTGNTQHLQYFINATNSSTTVTGNTTNTMLPNKVGP